MGDDGRRGGGEKSRRRLKGCSKVSLMLSKNASSASFAAMRFSATAALDLTTTSWADLSDGVDCAYSTKERLLRVVQLSCCRNLAQINRSGV